MMEVRMKSFIKELIEQKEDNYILPFFWQHGESEEKLREYMEAIHSCGIRAVCVEARPHPDYLGPGWWHDMDIIIDEAKKRDMKLWILDDAHFPTGYAAGKIAESEDKYCKQYISRKFIDVSGPTPEVEVSLAAMMMPMMLPSGLNLEMFGMSSEKKRYFTDDRILSIRAYQMDRDSSLIGEGIDLIENIVNGKLIWDVPQGTWRINVLFITRNGGGRCDYISMVDKASCRIQIDAVYEPHYEHYKEEFGKTIAGFFSDEPCLGNSIGYNFDESIGKKKAPLPWSSQLEKMLEEKLGKEYLPYYPALWTDMADEKVNARVRYAYMDCVTRLVEENFSRQIGQWCEERGVEYIGHIVEDNNQHSRLGSSQGHFFRSMMGQHMSGIDNIGDQVLPGGENHKREALLGADKDGEFYHYELGKLGSSLAHIDPKKQGRAMCEIFGAYGWRLGIRTMKYLTDHFLVRGINVYVPHAFSPKDFPDSDCPPHFYAGGEDPQFNYFKKLMHYTNRMCHLLNGGTHIAPAAVLYHGEAEWTGGCMFNQKVARELLESQIDFDILPSDVFADMSAYKAAFDGCLQVNGESYDCFIVPYAEFITKEVAVFAGTASKKGFSVFFVQGLPEGICNIDKQEEEKLLLDGLSECIVVPLEALSKTLKDNKLFEISSDNEFDALRYYHYRKEQTELYMFSNESIGKEYNGWITVKSKGEVSLYDAMDNRIIPAEYRNTEDGTSIYIRLTPYQSVVALFEDLKEVEEQGDFKAKLGYRLDAAWRISSAEVSQYPEFHPVEVTRELRSMGRVLPAFSGYLRYESEFIYDIMPTGMELLNITDVYEGAEVWLNGRYLGMKICPPYQFPLGEALRAGENHIRIEVATTLDRKVKSLPQDMRSLMFYSKITEPTGIVGSVEIWS